MRVAVGPVHGPCHRSRANDTGAATSSKMRDSPKDLTAAPHEVSPHVMKPSRPPLDAGARGVGGGILRYPLPLGNDATAICSRWRCGTSYWSAGTFQRKA